MKKREINNRRKKKRLNNRCRRCKNTGYLLGEETVIIGGEIANERIICDCGKAILETQEV